MVERIVTKVTSGKWIMTIGFTVTTCHLAWIGSIPVEVFIPLTTMIVGAYFYKKVE